MVNPSTRTDASHRETSRLHSWLSSKCAVKPSSLSGRGVFAIGKIEADEVVCVWGGNVYTREEIGFLGSLFKNFNVFPIEVSPGLFLGSNSLHGIDDAERFNHGCDPNLTIDGKIVVKASREIVPGEELVFDYESVSSEGTRFKCRCGSPICRKIINKWPEATVQE